MRVTFLFLTFACFLFYRSHICNGENLYYVNVSPVPSPPLKPLIRSELRPLVKNLHIELASMLKKSSISMILGLLFLLNLDNLLYNYRFISFNTCTNTLTSVSKKRFSSIYRDLHFILLILAFFIVFDFFFIIILPSELFEVQLLTKHRMKQTCRIVKFIHCGCFNLSFYAYKRSLPDLSNSNIFEPLPM